MLQAFVPSRGDAWAAMLDALVTDPVRALEMAAAVGGVTARMHAALASRPDDPAFPARPATVAEAAVVACLRRATARPGRHGGQRRASRPAGGACPANHRPLRRHVRLGERRGHGRPHPRGLPPRPAAGTCRRRLQRHRLRGRAGTARWLSGESPPRHCATSPACSAASTTRRGAPSAGRTPTGFDAEGWLVEARGAFLTAYGTIGSRRPGPGRRVRAGEGVLRGPLRGEQPSGLDLAAPGRG